MFMLKEVFPIPPLPVPTQITFVCFIVFNSEDCLHILNAYELFKMALRNYKKDNSPRDRLLLKLEE